MAKTPARSAKAVGAGSPRPVSKAKAAPRAAAAVNWAKLEASPQFSRLKASKAAFIVPACAIFLAYYFALPILVGYAPELMARKVYGALNVAYLFALSQFFMAWIIAGLYVRAANRHDKQAEAVIALAGKGGR